MKLTIKKIIVVVLFFVFVFSITSPIFAWVTSDARIDSIPTTYKHRTGSATAVVNAFDLARGYWNSSVTGLYLTLNSSSANEAATQNIVGGVRGEAYRYNWLYINGKPKVNIVGGYLFLEAFQNYVVYVNLAFSQVTNGYTSTAGHELGHVFGLSHSTVSNSLMDGNRNIETVYTPKSDDINGVKAHCGL